MHENLVRIKAVHQALKGFEQDYVFVGGATVSLYATNPGLAAEIRPKDDVKTSIRFPDVLFQIRVTNRQSSRLGTSLQAY
jgi:hypothetical protein